MPIDPDDEFLDTPEAATVLNVSPSYLNKARLTGDGPDYVKFGKSVRYQRRALRRYAATRTRRSTSEAA